MFSSTSEPMQISRDCDAIMIPSGDLVELPAGTTGYITQSLGGSFTVFVDGNLFRIAGQDADALGKEPLPQPVLEEGATNEDVERLIWSQLKTCYDPEIPVNVVDLGLIYECDVVHGAKRDISVTMTLTAPGCGMGDVLVEDVRSKLKLVPTVGDVDVELTFDPPWSYNMMSDVAKLETGMM
ncbi:MAG: putative Fe-S cluster assembly protein SufT [Lysobacteraceae bacterium]|nr:MAG: putative Fe-S cluster assembly protein SufT [Xanthomonadaceae bacterium]